MNHCRISTAALIVLLSLICGVGYAKGRTKIAGRISAYHPSQRLPLPSFIEHREEFLFQVDGKSAKVIKLVYVHEGPSNLDDDLIYNATDISIDAYRTRSCDQSLESFKTFKSDTQLSDGSSPLPIVFTRSIPSLPGSYHLACFELYQWAAVGFPSHSSVRAAHP
jgi:hypothetical protein